MDLQQILQMFLRSNPKWARKLEAITGQPIDHSIKCINGFVEDLNKGPGLVKPENKAESFKANYQLVMGLGGFKDYEAQILAADMSGFTLAEVTQHFRMHLNWDTTVDEVENIYESILPRFKEAGKKAGLFKEEKPVDIGIPNLGNRKPESSSQGNGLASPPWKQNSSGANNNSAVSPEIK